jgi:hypothetical protein
MRIITFIGAGDFITRSSGETRVAETNSVLANASSVAVIKALLDFTRDTWPPRIADHGTIDA